MVRIALDLMGAFALGIDDRIGIGEFYEMDFDFAVHRQNKFVVSGGVPGRHAFGADNRGQSCGIAPDGHRVPAGQGQCDMAPACALYRGDQASARAGHQRRPACLRDRSYHLDSATLNAAGDQRGQHLKHDDVAASDVHGQSRTCVGTG